MVTLEDIGKALMRCSGYAPQITPQPSEAVAAAWMEHFSDYPGVTGEDLMKAVKEFFTQPRERQVQPADISAIARKYSRDRWERSDLDSEERLALEAVCNAKAAPDTSSAAVQALERGGGGGGLPAEDWKGRAALRGPQRLEEIRNFSFAPKPPAPDADADPAKPLDSEALAARQREATPPTIPPCPDCGVTAVPCRCDDNEKEQNDAKSEQPAS